MSAVTIVNEKPGHFIVDGDLTFAAIDKKTLNSIAVITAAKQITMDLGGVGNADSAGLALMIEWIKVSRSKRIKLRFLNVPEQLLNLAKLSGLDSMGYFVASQPGFAAEDASS